MSISDRDRVESRIARAIAAGLRVAAEMIENEADLVEEEAAPAYEPSSAVRAAANDAGEALGRLEAVPADIAPEPTELSAFVPPVEQQPTKKFASWSVSIAKLKALTGLTEDELKTAALAMSVDEIEADRRDGFLKLRPPPGFKIAGFALAEAAE